MGAYSFNRTRYNLDIIIVDDLLLNIPYIVKEEMKTRDTLAKGTANEATTVLNVNKRLVCSASMAA